MKCYPECYPQIVCKHVYNSFNSSTNLRNPAIHVYSFVLSTIFSTKILACIAFYMGISDDFPQIHTPYKNY